MTPQTDNAMETVFGLLDNDMAELLTASTRAEVAKAKAEYEAVLELVRAAEWAEEHIGSIQEVKEALANLAAIRKGGV